MTHAEFESLAGMEISEIDFQNIILPFVEAFFIGGNELREYARLWTSPLFRDFAKALADKTRSEERLRADLEKTAKLCLEKGDNYLDSALVDRATEILGRNKVIEIKIREEWPLEDDEKDVIIALLNQQ